MYFALERFTDGGQPQTLLAEVMRCATGIE